LSQNHTKGHKRDRETERERMYLVAITFHAWGRDIC